MFKIPFHSEDQNWQIPPELFIYSLPDQDSPFFENVPELTNVHDLIEIKGVTITSEGLEFDGSEEDFEIAMMIYCHEKYNAPYPDFWKIPHSKTGFAKLRKLNLV